jgi:hypothetical protein
MPSPQPHASDDADASTIEEIKTTLYVDSARLKVLSQETKVHTADDDDTQLSVLPGESL